MKSRAPPCPKLCNTGRRRGLRPRTPSIAVQKLEHVQEVVEPLVLKNWGVGCQIPLSRPFLGALSFQALHYTPCFRHGYGQKGAALRENCLLQGHKIRMSFKVCMRAQQQLTVGKGVYFPQLWSSRFPSALRLSEATLHDHTKPHQHVF